ncbi:MAG: hypothetical protein AAF090_11890 [Bacteroidota bacterium]
MIKPYLLLLSLLFLLCQGIAQNDGNYIVVINSDSIPVDLNGSIEYKPKSKQPLTIKVIQPEILTYSDDMIAFKYDKALSVSNSVIEEGIEQCMIMKSTGNGFMIQKYSTLDPSSLTRLMLNEITKESINYGYEKTEKDFKKTLKSGQTIEGVEAVLTYKGERETYTVATYGEKDEGIILVTMLLNEDYAEDKAFIDLFLETLTLKGGTSK